MDHYLVSARKYRPATFASVVGQKALTATLCNAIKSGRLAHSYLFCGSRGVGKTSCARIFAKTINCEHLTPEGEACNECPSCRAFNDGNSLNIIELDAASNNGVDAMHSLIDQVMVPPSRGRYRVFIVDEVHMLSTAAFNAFLKTLEEPPSYVIFILATTEKHKIIPTILSRCQIYDFNRITINDMIEHLSYVAAQEGINAEPAALNVIARKADGAMRDALSIFDQVAASTRGNITYQATIDNLNVLDNTYYDRLLDAFIGGKVLDAWLIYKEIRDKGFDSHFFINGLASYLRDLMAAGNPATLSLIEAGDDARRSLAEAASKCTPDFLYRSLCLCNDADLNYRVATNKQFLVEVTLAKLCQLCSPSPDNSGQGEGRLKPIARPDSPTKQPAPQQPQAASPQPQPVASSPAAPPRSAPAAGATAAAHVSQSQPGRRPGPAAAARGHLGPSLSINPARAAARPADAEPAAAEPAAPATVNKSAYTPEALQQAWDEFIDANPHAHILVNTMRACRPVNIEGDRWLMTVENEMQQQTVAHAMPAIMQWVHRRLSNDMVTIDTAINEGESSPATWTERDVLTYMANESPGFKDFVTKLQLKL